MLTKIADDVLGADASFRIAAGVYFPVRMTVLRLRTGGLLLHSPVPIDDRLAAALADLGPVEHIVAPNCFHHTYVGMAADRYPNARVHAAPGLTEKRPDLRIDATLESGVTFGDDVEVIVMRGAPAMNEAWLIHRPSGTLLVTDLVFNIRAPEGALTPWVLRLMGAHEKLAPSRAWRFIVTKDRAAARESVETLLAKDFDRLVPAHGQVVEAGARAALAAAVATTFSD